MVDFSGIHAKMKWMAEKGQSLSRFGIADAVGKITYEECGVCYQGLQYSLSQGRVGKYAFTTWYGEAPDGNEREGGRGGRDYPYNRRSQFIPGPLSDRWLEFLLSPISPWKSLHPHIVNRDDVESIRHGGMIIDLTHKDLTFSQVYNFLIATRWSYEFNHKARFWAEMVDTGVDPRVAFLIALAFTQTVEIKRELVREAGYRKEKNENTGREVFIKDDWGEKKYFEAEYKELGRTVTDKLIPLWGENHEPLYNLNSVCYRVFHGEPDLSGRKQALTGNANHDAWGIWNGKTNHSAAVSALKNKTLTEAIKVVSEISMKL